MRLPEYLGIEEAVMPAWNYYVWTFGLAGAVLGTWAIKRDFFV